MRNKEDLVHLIRSMSRSEKRYFTLDAQKGGRRGSQYLELFQAINAMDEYDEEVLKAQFGSSLPFDKGYLYEAILRSMRDYRSSKSASAQIREKVLDFRFLYERGLYDQAEQRLEEARDLAAELGDLPVLLEVNRLAWDLVWIKKGNYEERIRQLTLEEKRYLEAFAEELRYLETCFQLTAELKGKLDYNDPERRRELKGKYPDHLFEAAQEPASMHARRRFLQSRAMVRQLMGDIGAYATNYEQVLDWWDVNQKYRKEEFHRYIVDVANLLHAYAQQERFDAFPELLDRLAKESGTSVHDQALAFQNLAIYKLMYYLNTGEDEGLPDLLALIESGLRQYRINIGSRMAILFNTASLLFIREEFAECIRWCDKIIRDIKTSYRLDIQRVIHVIKVVASQESQDVERSENDLRAARRYLQQKVGREAARLELALIDRVRVLESTPLDSKREALEALDAHLSRLFKEPYEPIQRGVIQLLQLWIQGRLKKKPILSLLRENR